MNVVLGAIGFLLAALVASRRLRRLVASWTATGPAGRGASATRRPLAAALAIGFAVLWFAAVILLVVVVRG